MKNSQRYKKAKKLFPNAKISRVAGFLRVDNTVYISGHDEDVVLIIDGKDLATLLNTIPLDPVMDKLRHIQAINHELRSR